MPTSSQSVMPPDPSPEATIHAQPLGTRLVVAAAVLDSLSRPTALLCASRSYPPEHAGQFELPGGKTEKGEAPKEALVRELREELSLEVRLGAEVPPSLELTVRGPDDTPAWSVTRGYRMRVWLAEPLTPTPAPQPGSSHQRVEWVRLEETKALRWLPADLPVLDTVLATVLPETFPRQLAATQFPTTARALPV